MVEAAISKINKQRSTNHKNSTLVDVGTGSGCIPISIAKAMKQYNNITIYASDISQKALRIAKKNAKKHNTDIHFLKGNLLDPVKKQLEQLQQSEHSELIITANLPYLTEEQFAEEPSIRREPKTALVANRGGLALYEELLKQIKEIVTEYRLQGTGFFEIDPSQSKPIKNIIKKYLPNAHINIHKDLRGQDRIVRIELNQT
jgi:release factor glutamine methyltransferase